MTTPAGWYDDGQGNLRWWDGSQWTEHIHKPEPQPPQVPQVPQVPQGFGAGPQSPAGSHTAPPQAGYPQSQGSYPQAQGGQLQVGYPQSQEYQPQSGYPQAQGIQTQAGYPQPQGSQPQAGQAQSQGYRPVISAKEPAPWLHRVGATLLDGLILGIPAAIIGTVLSGVVLAGDLKGENASLGIAGTLAVPLLINALIIGAIIWLISRSGAKNGQSLGKQILGLRIIRQDGQPMDTSTSFMREAVCKGVVPSFIITLLSIFVSPAFGYLILVLGAYVIIDILYPLFDDNNQALHDKFTGTQVIKE